MKRKIPLTLKKIPKIDGKTLKLFMLIFFIAGIINMWLFTLRHEEPRRGIVALEMLFRHNFFQPTVLMQPYFKKPPLHNWIITLFSFLNTKMISEFTMRLPSLIATILTGTGIYLFAKKFLKEKVAVFSSIIFITTGLVLIEYSTKCEPDMLFTFFVFLSITTWYILSCEKKEILAWIFGYFFTSLSLLTKGLPGAAFFIISTFSILFIRKELKKFFSPAHFIGLIIGITPFALWILAVSPEKAIITLWKESANRTAIANSIIKVLAGIILFFPKLFYALVPWSVIVILESYKTQEKIKKALNHPFLKEILLIIGSNMIIYIFSPGTRIRYLIPIFPFISILFAYILSEKKVSFKRGVGTIQLLMDILLFIGIIGTIWLTLRTDIALNATVFFLIISYLTYFYYMKRIDLTNFILIVGCALLIIRGFYSSYYLSVGEFKRPNYRKVSREIAHLTKKNPLYTITPDTKLGFYIEKVRQIPLPLKKYGNIPKNSYFISEGKKEGETVKKFKLGEKTFYLCQKK